MWRGAGAAVALCAGIYSLQAQAAWLQTKGEGLIISSVSTYHSDARFERSGLRSPGREYNKQELSVYGVYGLTGRLTVGAQPTFFQVRTENGTSPGHETMHGLSQIDLFARTRIAAADYWILSGQALIKLPGPRAVDREPLLENASRDAEARLLFGRSGRLVWHILNLEFFSSIEAGYRIRDGGAADQWRGDAAFGVRPLQNYQIIVQSFNIVSSRRPDDSDPTAYDLFKAQISVVRDLPHGMALQAGASSEYAGRNIGAGDGLFIAVWSRF